MNLKKILKKTKLIYNFIKLYLEFTFRVFVVMILIKLGVVLKLFNSLNNYTTFAIVVSLLFFTTRPILNEIEWKFFRRESE